MRCSSTVERSAVNRVVAGSSPAAAAIFILALMAGCFFTYDDGHHDGYNDHSSSSSYYDYYPYLTDVGWDCYDGGTFDDWYFWARADHSYDLYELYYLNIVMYSLYENEVFEFNTHDHIHGYYESNINLYRIQCGDPVDIEYTIVDRDGNWETFVLYW